MRPNIASAAAAGLVLSFLSLNSAHACGAGFHRNSYGRCHPDAAPSVPAPLAPVVVAPEPVCRHGFHWDSTRRRCVVIYIGGA